MTLFERDGFVIRREPLVGDDLIARANEHADRVIAGDYETTVAPPFGWNPDRDPMSLVKIDNAHMCDKTLQELISHPALGEFAAANTGANMVQVWATQLLDKPGPGDLKGHVGWHQDDTYWFHWWEGEVFTVWLAMCDVTSEMGPMVFVNGSHEWGYREGGNFFDKQMDGTQAAMTPEGAVWEEIEVTLPRGGASMHHRRLIHGSKSNVSATTRRSWAIHMRTENSAFTELMPYKDLMDDEFVSPVIFRR